MELTIFLMLLRIGITIYCVNKAGQLNRSQAGWGIFGFFLPLIAVIWIQFMKPKMLWEDRSKNESEDVFRQDL